MTAPAVETVGLWHDALNSGDVDRLLVLSTEDVEVGGPRGSGHGASLLREWFGRAGVSMAPLQYFSRDSLVVVEQDAAWKAPGRTEPQTPQRVASVFVVRDGQVASVVRYPTLTDALGAAGLTEQDRV